ncbi:hypothetical protein ACFL1B_04670 [Nanoarchaeota archaeon]
MDGYLTMRGFQELSAQYFPVRNDKTDFTQFDNTEPYVRKSEAIDIFTELEGSPLEHEAEQSFAFTAINKAQEAINGNAMEFGLGMANFLGASFVSKYSAHKTKERSNSYAFSGGILSGAICGGYILFDVLAPLVEIAPLPAVGITAIGFISLWLGAAIYDGREPLSLVEN